MGTMRISVQAWYGFISHEQAPRISILKEKRQRSILGRPSEPAIVWTLIQDSLVRKQGTHDN